MHQFISLEQKSIFKRKKHKITGTCSQQYRSSTCDFWLFPKIKQQLKTRKYKNIFELKMDFEEMIRKLEKKDFEKCFNSWIKRCKQVILNN